MIEKIKKLNEELSVLQDKKNTDGLTPDELFLYHDLTAQVQKLASDYFAQLEESYLTQQENDSLIIMSNVTAESSGRTCAYCHKEEFLFTAQDEKTMRNYGCCKKCYCLHVE
jgi:hypothetical protein